MMCAKLLKHRKEGEKGRFYEVTEDYYNRVIAFYGRTVKLVLKHQTATLLVTFGTLILTLVMYVVVPKGFFPVQDTGVILGISQAPDRHLLRRYGETPAGTRQRSFCKIKMSRVFPRSSEWMARI